jgi:hypothetical protein
MVVAGLGGAFIQCSLALAGDSTATTLALAIVAVAIPLMVLNFISYRPVRKLPHAHVSTIRTMVGTIVLAAEAAAALGLLAGYALSLALMAVAMEAHLALMISSSWLLLLGVREDEQGNRIGPTDAR